MQELFSFFHVWEAQTQVEKTGINLGIAKKIVQNKAYNSGK